MKTADKRVERIHILSDTWVENSEMPSVSTYLQILFRRGIKISRMTAHRDITIFKKEIGL
jgi:hypothetical protein